MISIMKQNNGFIVFELFFKMYVALNAFYQQFGIENARQGTKLTIISASKNDRSSYKQLLSNEKNRTF